MMSHCYVWSKSFWTQLLVVFLILCLHFCQIGGQIDPTKCGRREVDATFLIHRGRQAQEGHWPWHATIYRVINNKTDYICGGSILDRHTILTAAHCFFIYIRGEGFRSLREDQISVHVGREHISASNVNIQVPTVANIITHPEFSMSNVVNDIAIVKLSSAINITYFVRPVCLWTLNDELHRFVGTNGTVIGFGFTEEDKTSDTLREATLTVVDVTTCLISDRQTYGSLLNHNMFCAGGNNNVSACNGDSGGGIFFNINGTWHLLGIVSFIPGRPNAVQKVCDSSKYTVFTDVSGFAAWILQYTTTAKWRKDLRPCQDGVDDKAILCNAAIRHDNNFLLVNTETGIGRVSLSDGKNFTIFDLSSTDGVIEHIGYDCATDRVYWTQNMDGNIYSMINDDGADQRPFIANATGEPFYLTIDWISRRLYWYDRKKKTIEVASLENPDLRAVLFTNLESVWSIAVDPLIGKLYWTERNVKLESSNLDGTERQIVIERPRVKNIDDIKVSMATGELCYVDQALQQINCINTRTKQIRKTISNFTTGWTYFAIDDEFLYWSEKYSDIIERVDNYGVRRKPINFPWSSELYQIEAVTGLCPMFHSQCAIRNGGCPKNTICLLSPRESSGKICKPVET